MITQPAARTWFSMCWSLQGAEDVSATLYHVEIEATFETAAPSTGTAV